MTKRKEPGQVWAWLVTAWIVFSVLTWVPQ